MRIVVMGTGQFAVPMFEALLTAGHEVPALITRPVPPATGRKKESLHPNPMRDFATSRNIAVFAPQTANSEEARAALRAYAPDLLAVCDYGEILSPETLAVAPLGGINLHASLLPKYRGAAPINWAILKGEQETGITVIHMTPKLDGGPILNVARTNIAADETSANLEPRLALLGVPAVLDSINQLAAWDGQSPIGIRQDQSLATHARRLRKSDGNVQWTHSAKHISNQVRGLQPWPGVYTHYLKPGSSPVRLILDRVSVLDPLTFDEPIREISPGTVALVNHQRLVIQTGDGLFSLDRVQPAGKRIMPISEFLRGYKIAPGDRFGDVE